MLFEGTCAGGLASTEQESEKNAPLLSNGAFLRSTTTGLSEKY
jgi:hypothetical protein